MLSRNPRPPLTHPRRRSDGLWRHQDASMLPDDAYPQFFALGDGCRVWDVNARRTTPGSSSEVGAAGVRFGEEGLCENDAEDARAS
jgi:hypothetical protein